MTGYTTIFNIVEFPKILDFKLTVLYPSKSDYNLAIKLSKDVLRIGKPLPAIDIRGCNGIEQKYETRNIG